MAKRTDPAGIVAGGYDAIAQTYHDQRDQFKSHGLLREFASRLPPGGEVLDAGCGAGVPVAVFLVDAGFRVTGVDLSAAMLDLARSHVPEARLLQMDMRRLGFAEPGFDGICAFYSLFHVPREDHLPVLVQFHRLLRPGGVLLFSSGTHAWQGVEGFHGTEMFWSHPEREVTRAWVVEAGFAVVMAEVRELGGEAHYWVMGRKG